MARRLDESTVERAALQWLRELGYGYAHGPDISPGGSAPERASFTEVVLVGRLRAALERLNPHLSAAALDDAARQVLDLDAPDVLTNNRRFHEMLRDGAPVEDVTPDGERRGLRARLFDDERPERNDWLAVNQFTITDGDRNRRPDIIVFVNGLPLALFELKNPLDPTATVEGAYRQLQTYQSQIPAVFTYNEVLVVSDLTVARHGTLTSDWPRFAPWRAINIDGEADADAAISELETLVRGMFAPATFLDLARHFVVYETNGPAVAKIMAMSHQYHGVNRAVAETVRATGPDGDRHIGVVWHTQGSGKSLSMVFYAGKIIGHPALENPTLLMLTDRNDLDEQLSGAFGRAASLLPRPERADDVAALKRLLAVPAGGVVFSTIQKFQPDKGGDYPRLSERRNIVVIADEAHRSQYSFTRGYARHLRDALPNASFIGFTGTPIETDDKSTRQVFGDYIHIYDIRHAIDDGATVPIYYEGRLARLHLTNELIDEDFEDVTEGQEDEVKGKLQSKWARLEAMVGTPERLQNIADDLVAHYHKRSEALEGKAMIVCMSRRICVELYDALRRVPGCPETAVIMTGSATDPPEYQRHLYSHVKREELKERFKRPDDPLTFVIVRDMWLTGFDAPVLHTMYVDKPMQGHNLMQAIARVNRVFRDKPGGLIVDYIGIADDLKRALTQYTDSARDEAMLPIDVALDLTREKHDVVAAFFHGINYHGWTRRAPAAQVTLLQRAVGAVGGDDEVKRDFLQACAELTKAIALVNARPEIDPLRDDVLFFQAVRRNVVKYTPTSGGPSPAVEAAVKQLVSESVSATGVIDIFDVAGAATPDISILSDAFLDEVRGMAHPNVQFEVLRKLLEDEINGKLRRNVVTYRSFKERLEESIAAYLSRSVQSAEVISALIAMARELRGVDNRAAALGLSDEEVAFYDVLAHGGADALDVSEPLRALVRDLMVAIKGTLSIDWTDHESTRAGVRVAVKRVLRRSRLPATDIEALLPTLMEQAESLYHDWPMAA